MKKILVSCFALILSASMLYAGDGFQLGVKAGFNSSSFDTSNGVKLNNETYQNVKNDFKSGYILGAWTSFPLDGNISLRPEVYYSKKSGKVEYDSEISETLNYYSWDIPVLVKLNILDLDVVNIYGLAGPALSIRADEKVSVDELNFDSGKMKSANWNLQLGAGVEVMRFGLDARYEWGLNDISSKSGIDRKTRALMFSLSYRLF